MADVASALRSWSVTPGSNSPTTSTVVGAGLSGNLQQIQATTRQYLASIGSSVICSATTDLSTVDGYTIPLSGNSTVTSFGTEAAGISYRLQFSGTPLLKNSTAIQCPVSADLQIAANDIITVTSQGSGNWKVSPDAIATGKFSAIDTGTTGSLSLKTNNGTTGFRLDNIASGVNFLAIRSAATTGSPAAYATGSDANQTWDFGIKGTTGTFNFKSDFESAPVLQFQIVPAAGSTRSVTVTGSNGGNPTISTTAGSLAITPAVVIAGASISIGTTPASGTGTVRTPYGQCLSARNSANSADFVLLDIETLNSVTDLVRIGIATNGVMIRGRSAAGAPTASDLPAGEFTVAKETGGGTVKLYYNDGGSIKTVALA